MIVKVDRLRYDTDLFEYVWLRDKMRVISCVSGADSCHLFYAALGHVLKNATVHRGELTMAFYANHADVQKLTFGKRLVLNYGHDFNFLLFKRNKRVKGKELR